MPRQNHSVIMFIAVLAVTGAKVADAQAPVKLTLLEAETLALKNHPQVLAAQHEISISDQQVNEARAPYYPLVSAELTGSLGTVDSRIGAGALVASRLFNRFGQGIVLSQLITDSGRTPNLVASSRLEVQASAQNYQSTRYDVLLRVNQAYFNALRAQATVKVAQETVAARELLDNQVSTLAKNNLRSQLDVSFADVNVSEAKLLLLRAQDGVQEAFAELTRAMGTDRPGNYQLIDELLPPAPPATAAELVVQALNNRPEISSLQFSRDAAYKFEEAEKDLSRPTISLVGVAGFLPLINEGNGPPIPNEYAGAAVNINIPIFNGHLFSARREAARYRAMVADQRLRNEQERLARDARVAWAGAMNAYQRLDVTAQFLRQAALALDLAQGRYNLGLADIVALTQAQLNVTKAEIENLSAKYDYQTQYAFLQYTIGLLR